MAKSLVTDRAVGVSIVFGMFVWVRKALACLGKHPSERAYKLLL